MNIYMYIVLITSAVLILVALHIADNQQDEKHKAYMRAMLGTSPHHDHTLAINMRDVLILLESHQYDESDKQQLCVFGSRLLNDIATPAVN